MGLSDRGKRNDRQRYGREISPEVSKCRALQCCGQRPGKQGGIVDNFAQNVHRACQQIAALQCARGKLPQGECRENGHQSASRIHTA